MDYLDELERQRTTQPAPHPQQPPPLVPGYPTGQVPPGVTPLQSATPQAMSAVRAVGLAQRRIMWVILGAVLLMFSFPVGGYLMAATGALAMIAVLGLARLAILALMMIGVYQLSAALGKSMATRVLFVIAMLLPLIGLIVLLVVNQQATNLLRRHNIRVGLMGPRVADLPAA